MNTEKKQRMLQGKVIGNRMDKTAVVQVVRTKIHPLYKKRYQVTTKYKIHDPENKAQIGDIVIFAAFRPMSKEKRWKLVEITKSATI
ncbi:MAG: 30S ribosomal protein S17 [bacterium]|nr:30S ribosomal protein S17 [bacterium]